jgi:hypothetical protein
MTYSEAYDLLKSHNYPVFSGIMDPTLFGIRTNQTYTNAFTDVLGVLWMEPTGEKKIITIEGTTKPGLYGEGGILNPKMIKGIIGTAVMARGHYSRLWTMVNFEQIDTKKGMDKITAKSFNPWAYPYLYQIGKCRIYRDGNMDLTINKEIEVDSFGDGINYHIMGNDQTPKIYVDDNLNTWSLGCQGAPASEFAKIATILARCIPYSGKVVSYSLIEQ